METVVSAEFHFNSLGITRPNANVAAKCIADATVAKSKICSGWSDRNDVASAPTIITVGRANKTDVAEKTLSFLAITIGLADLISEPARIGNKMVMSIDSNITI